MKLSKKYLCCFLVAIMFCVIVSGGCGGGSGGGGSSGGNDTTNETPNENENPNNPSNPTSDDVYNLNGTWRIESGTMITTLHSGVVNGRWTYVAGSVRPFNIAVTKANDNLLAITLSGEAVEESKNRWYELMGYSYSGDEFGSVLVQFVNDENATTYWNVFFYGNPYYQYNGTNTYSMEGDTFSYTYTVSDDETVEYVLHGAGDNQTNTTNIILKRVSE